MNITIHTFAALKEHFSPEFDLSVEKNSTLTEVIAALKSLNPQASTIIDNCRVAINESIVSTNINVRENEHIFFIPPSSGG